MLSYYLYLAVFFYAAAMLSVFLTKRMALPIALISVGLCFALAAGYVSVFSLPFFLLIFYVTNVYFTAQSTWAKVVAGSGFFLIGVFTFSSLIPDVRQWRCFEAVQLSEGALPFTFQFLFDVPLIGLAVILFAVPSVCTKAEWLTVFQVLKRLIPCMLVTICSMALLMHYVNWDFKLTPLFFLWSLSNLFFVCVTEEAIFRRFFQDTFRQLFKRFAYGDYMAIAVASLLFGIAHFAGGMLYVILATVAGGFYGWAYYKTARLEASILAHYSMNAVHFVFFTYPVLSSAL